MNRLLLLLLLILPLAASAQTITDGLMMPKNDFCMGLLYTHDSWSSYWEGGLKRDNENIGRLTTHSLMWAGSYGLHERVNLIAMLPYMWTRASQGTLHSAEGLQDVSFAVKYNFFKQRLASAYFNTFAVAAFSTPVGSYTPDYFPLALGTSTHNLSGRLTASFKVDRGFYFNGTGAYTWRSNTRLDRPSYYTAGQLYLTDEVEMPDVFDFSASLGYLRGGFQAEVHYLQQNTLGGGDIRRQDMPFVSNRMSSSRAGVLGVYFLPMVEGLALRASASTTLTGRNVGDSTNVTGGLLYTFHFGEKAGPGGQP